MNQQVEKIILKNLIQEPEYVRKVLPFIKDDYFTREEDKVLFREIKDFIVKYNKPPTFEVLDIEVGMIKSLKEEQIKIIKDNLLEFRSSTDKQELEWLLDTTEKFCKDRAIYLGIMKSIDILNDKDKKLSTAAIPKILEDAISVSFDTSIGHDYLIDDDVRFDFYHSTTERVAFDLEIFNKVTKNGLPRKSLSVIMGGTGGGKSLMMGHMAASALMDGKNVLYITLELSQESISQRIDMNLLNMPDYEILRLSRDEYKARVSKLRQKTQGKLIVKEYPSGDASVIHFRNLLNELKLKKNFVPDIIFVDYINLCSSATMRDASDTYNYVKMIAVELRGLAVIQDVPIVTATQTNRAGWKSSDVELDNVSESWGLPATADFFIVLINTEELMALNQIMIKVLKNRWNDPNFFRKFVLGIDRQRMKLYDLEESAQENLNDVGTDNKEKPVTSSNGYKADKSLNKFKNNLKV